MSTLEFEKYKKYHVYDFGTQEWISNAGFDTKEEAQTFRDAYIKKFNLGKQFVPVFSDEDI